LTLAGFAARRNQPSRAIDDLLEVHLLSIEFEEKLVLLAAYDLVGLGPELTLRIQERLRSLPQLASRDFELVLCSTHTHSAPATVKLIGCGIEEPSYWDQLVEETVDAVTDSLASLKPAVTRYATVPIKDVSYNRRKVLSDGRVVMSPKPNQQVVKEGPVWERLLLVRFEEPNGSEIGGIISWAAHPCVVCSPNISADYPGELRRIASRAYKTPFLFLQGPSANINLPFEEMTRAEMLQSVDRLAPRIDGIQWSEPLASLRSGFLRNSLRIDYNPLPTRDELQLFGEGMGAVAETGSGPHDTMALLANILNIEPGASVDHEMLRHIAGSLREWSDVWIQRFDQMPSGTDLELGVLKLGPLFFCFAAAELFSETGLELQSRYPDELVTPVAYSSPLIGYLPTDEALEEGGYEVEHAYRFYGHPGPFAAGSERKVCDAFDALIKQVKEVES